MNTQKIIGLSMAFVSILINIFGPVELFPFALILGGTGFYLFYFFHVKSDKEKIYKKFFKRVDAIVSESILERDNNKFIATKIVEELYDVKRKLEEEKS